MTDRTKQQKAQPAQEVKKVVHSPDEIAVLSQQVEEYKNKYLRSLADYQNLEKRVDEDRIQVRQNANRFLLLKLLPFIDNLDRAEVFVKDTNLQMVRNEFMKVLKDEGVEELVVLGKEYDPHTAEVIDIVKGEKDNFIVEVLRKGYVYNGNILRVAQVRVSKKAVQNSESRVQN